MTIIAPALIAPKKFSVHEQNVHDIYSNEIEEVITVEPFAPGFGITVANSLRRVMLSVTPGFSIVSFSIPGTFHEFSSLEGVLEDCVEIGLNLKKVSLTKPNSEVEEFVLQADETGTITARAFEAHGCTVFNPDHVICTLTKPRHFEMKVRIMYGAGYLSADDQEQEDGWIHLETYFSPVRRVAFYIEKMRVGDQVNCDRAIFHIITNKSIPALKALQCACTVAIDQYRAILDLEKDHGIVSEVLVPKAAPTPSPTVNIPNAAILEKSLTEMGFDQRAVARLREYGIVYLNQFLRYEEGDLQVIPNLGKKTIDKCVAILANHGLVLGMLKDKNDPM